MMVHIESGPLRAHRPVCPTLSICCHSPSPPSPLCSLACGADHWATSKAASPLPSSGVQSMTGFSRPQTFPAGHPAAPLKPRPRQTALLPAPGSYLFPAGTPCPAACNLFSFFLQTSFEHLLCSARAEGGLKSAFYDGTTVGFRAGPSSGEQWARAAECVGLGGNWNQEARSPVQVGDSEDSSGCSGRADTTGTLEEALSVFAEEVKARRLPSAGPCGERF